MGEKSPWLQYKPLVLCCPGNDTVSQCEVHRPVPGKGGLTGRGREFNAWRFFFTRNTCLDTENDKSQK